MDINKIHDAMKVLKDECKRYTACKDCVFYDTKNKNSCYLEKVPDTWKEDEIFENNCTTVTVNTDEWYCGLVMKCDNCDEEFMLGGCYRDHIIEKVCPHCGKKIVNYREKEESDENN